MDDTLDSLVEGVTEQNAGQTDAEEAVSALVSPEVLERMRGTRREPPRAKRAPEPQEAAGNGSEDDAEAERQRGRERWLKRDWIAEAERLQQELDDAQALKEAQEQEQAQTRQQAQTDPDALRELTETIAFVAQYAFTVTAAVRGPHWKITDENAERIGKPGAKLLALFAGDLPAWLLPAVSLSTAIAGTVAEKIVEEKRINALQSVEAP